jgi:hypothetical protein
MFEQFFSRYLAMNTSCPFIVATKMFKGTFAEQAMCLLRRVRILGNVDDAPTPVPDALLTRVGKAVDFTRADLEAYLSRNGIAAADIGGALDDVLSETPDGRTALYFVIHDTSDEISGNSFPSNIDDASWSGNNLASRNVSSAHVFLNRVGQSRTGHKYSVGHRATKFERPQSRGVKGLFLHHELIQPRIKGGFAFHAVGPDPGFPPAQLERLALCYLAASLRRGSWMIPAFHCVLDLGIADGHDDPQNFDLFQWAGIVERLHADVKAPQPAVGSMGMAESVMASAAASAAPDIEVVRTVSDGVRSVQVRRVKGTKPLFFKAKMAIDADGAARAYHPKDDPEALDVLVHANKFSKTFIQGKTKNGKVGMGPRPGFFVSATALQKGEDHDADAYVDAEFIPYIVLPDNFAVGVKPGCVCIVVNLKNDRVTPAIFADTNPKVGEASVRAAINLRVQEPSFPITELAKTGGDDGANYVYIVFPSSRLTPAANAPHWPADAIATKADALFAEWGGLAMVHEIFG